MREILFRGIPTFGKEFVYGYYNVYKKEGREIHEIIENKNGITRFEVDPKTVGQYTGLKDKTGKMIFEGDIVKGTSYGHPYTLEVEYIGGGFAPFAEFDEKVAVMFDDNSKCEIIGNKFQDKELLNNK